MVPSWADTVQRSVYVVKRKCGVVDYLMKLDETELGVLGTEGEFRARNFTMTIASGSTMSFRYAQKYQRKREPYGEVSFAWEAGIIPIAINHGFVHSHNVTPIE